jgi:UDP-glucose 4-epimerase
VFASTGGAIYGDRDEPASEDAPRRPLSPYGTAKLAGEEYIQTFNRLHGSGHAILRFGNVYGPRQDPHGEAGVVAIFMSRLHAGERPQVFGDGEQTRDYVYVADAVGAAVAALGHDGGTFNVGTGKETSVLDLLAHIQGVAGTNVEPEFAPPRPGELQRSVLDVSRVAAELDWRPEEDLDAGLAATWAWAISQ